jgi:hypothetical protein
VFITAIGIRVVTNGCFSAATEVVSPLLRLRLGTFIQALSRRGNRINATSGNRHVGCTIDNSEICCMSLHCRMNIVDMIGIFIVG